MSENLLQPSPTCCINGKSGGECAVCCCSSRHTAKLEALNWLKLIEQPQKYVEVRFKNTRKSYYLHNPEINKLQEGDLVVVEASPGYDLGVVMLTGELVLRQMARYRLNPEQQDFKKIYRKAKPQDIEKWNSVIKMEENVMVAARRICDKLELQMKIADVEYQADGTKIIFYYIAEERIDFRKLIVLLAQEFRVRVEMKQIGVRQEAGRVGGIASCGREMCCSKWLNSFTTVTTNNAKVQDLSLNQQKLAGQCGKLKCCLNFEYSTYVDSQKDFPKTTIILETTNGSAYHFKTDTHKRIMWYGFDRHSMVNLTALSVDRVNEIISLNQQGVKVESLLAETENNTPAKTDFLNAVGSESVTRFDKKKTFKPKQRSHKAPK